MSQGVIVSLGEQPPCGSGAMGVTLTTRLRVPDSPSPVFVYVTMPADCAPRMHVTRSIVSSAGRTCGVKRRAVKMHILCLATPQHLFSTGAIGIAECGALAH